VAKNQLINKIVIVNYQLLFSLRGSWRTSFLLFCLYL